MNTQEQASDAFLDHFLPGQSLVMRETRARLLRLNSSINQRLVRVVLIRGESGSGKGYLARVIAGHRRWQALGADENLGLAAGLDQYANRFPEINLTALPDSLAESELFGHKAGAYTGAARDRRGCFGQGLTDIFLDEIGDASLPLQAKLLTVLESGRFRPLGAEDGDEERSETRVITATNRDLETLASTGQFREDLLWRLRESVITVPPLRDQRDNIPAILLRLFLDLVVPLQPHISGFSSLPSLSAEDSMWASQQDWPGNIREMRHVVKRWLFEDGRISLSEAALLVKKDLSESRPRVDPVLHFVYSRLQESLALPESPYQQLRDVIDEAAGLAKDAVVKWYHSCRRDDAQLRHLFPDADPRAVRNAISKWRCS